MNRLAALLLLVLSLAALSAQASPGSLADKVAERTLPNGMKVLALRKPGAPVVALQMTYRAGAVDEPSGSTGMAHVLEHMLFKGTKTLGTRDWKAEAPLLDEIERVGRAADALARKGEGADAERLAALRAELAELARRHRPLVVSSEIDALYAKNGAVGFNASTSMDMTSYVVSLPANRLELWAAIESERLRDPVLREYYVERDVVREERRQRREADPDGALHEALLATAFSAHPYRNPVIGWGADLATLDIARTRRFFEDFYGPGNVVVAAVGDLDPEAFFALVERYFGDIPRRPVERPVPTAEPPQKGARRVEVVFDAEPRAILAYHKPTLPHRDDYVFDVIEALLSDGRSSRLPRELVDRRKVAVAAGAAAGIPGARYPNLFCVFVTPAPGVAADAALDAARQVLRELAETPPSPEELEKVKTRLAAHRVRAMVSDAGLAQRLAYFETVAGDWRYIERHPEVIATITPEEVSRVAARYLVRENETAAVLVPEKRP